MDRHLFNYYSDMIEYLDDPDVFEDLHRGFKFRVSLKRERYVLEWI